MVDFEAYNYYTAGNSFVGVDGWQVCLGYDGPTVVTPAAGGSSYNTVLSGAQSGRIAAGASGTALFARMFSPTSASLADGTIVSGLMQMDGSAGGYSELLYSHNPSRGSTPAGIRGSAAANGNFSLFGSDDSVVGFYDTGVRSLANVNYLLEIELNLSDQSFTAYATNVTDGGERITLGSKALAAEIQITPATYAQSGFILASRNYGAAVFDDLDVSGLVIEPVEPVLTDKVDFELPAYVRGGGVVGKDGWQQPLGSASTLVINNAEVLEGSQSLRVAGGTHNILQRNFQEQTTYADGSVVSARMMLFSGAGGQGEFYFSHNQSGQLTPAGIVGVEGGNFWIFGLRDGTYDDPVKGLNTGVSFEAGIDYLLEMQFDFSNQLFYSYMTNLTAGGPRTLLGEAEFQLGEGEILEPGDGVNSGYVVKTRNNAVVIFDEFNLSPGVLPQSAAQSVPEPAAAVSLLIVFFALAALRRLRN